MGLQARGPVRCWGHGPGKGEGNGRTHVEEKGQGRRVAGDPRDDPVPTALGVSAVTIVPWEPQGSLTEQLWRDLI